MAEALITGLAGLTARTIEPLVSRLTDLGLEKPAALLGGLPARPDQPTDSTASSRCIRSPASHSSGWLGDDVRYIDAGATRARREHRDPAASGSARTPRVSRRSTRGQAQSLRGGLASRALRGVVARRVAHRMASHVGRRRSRAVYRRRRCAGRRSRGERGERDPRRQSGRSDRPADVFACWCRSARRLRPS